jgi:hypothetical protein
MPTHEIEERHRVKRWKGTVAEIADVFERAETLLQGVVPPDTEVKPSVSAEMLDGDLSFKDIAEFRQYGLEGKLKDAQRFSCWIHPYPNRFTLSVGFGVKPLPGARVSVKGTDHVAVSGIFQQLRKRLDSGSRHVPKQWPFRLALFLLPVCIAASWGFIDYSLAGFCLTGIAYLLAFWVAFWWPLDRLVPPLEILDSPDAATIYQRWRGRLFAGGFAIFLVVLGAVLSAVL